MLFQLMPQAILELASCIITGFHHHIKSLPDAFVSLRKCYLVESKKTSLVVDDPLFFSMVDTHILNSNERGLQMSFSGCPSPKKRVVQIRGC